MNNSISRYKAASNSYTYKEILDQLVEDLIPHSLHSIGDPSEGSWIRLIVVYYDSTTIEHKYFDMDGKRLSFHQIGE